ncbi:hypothetical protein SAMN00017477_0101 [Peptoniphilus asaccharolyticus DSM 20463]|uniref:Uncharacterized protein n=1 Tax=Peptoniphilus asaccharolyticus DSM 20463 TaxID=573058 RepID=A0A1W1UCI3_PEPAS|nr:hypothetical protein SAMN00017477_0101 [Peptoniphilus asaccharolyticus DSM 20463]
MSKKQKIYFYLYIFFMIFIPLFLDWITIFIPEPDLSKIHNPHAFQYIDDRTFFIALILNFGIYLYPLHFIFINKLTLKIKKNLFVLTSILSIMIVPISYMIYNFSIDDYFFVLAYILIIFILPFIIIYYIKSILYKRGA